MRIFTIIAIVLFFSCKTVQKTVSDLPVISMIKTACFGSCPVYEINIFYDGKVELKGEMFMDLIGGFRADLTKSELKQLINAFEERDFFAFEDEYSAKITDLPTTYLSFNYQGRNKKIKDYYNAPEELKALEKMVAELLEKLDWKPVN